MTTMTRDQLVEIIGPSAAIDYDQTRDEDKPALQLWVSLLRGLADEDFYSETENAIACAAQANADSEYWHESHVRATACIYEARRRNVDYGHDAACLDTMYARALQAVIRAFGHNPGEAPSCTCGKGS